MKKLLFLLAILCTVQSVQAQKIDYLRPVAYSKQNPSAAPTSTKPSQLWLNTETGTLWVWDKAERDWAHVANDYYGEMGISNDTIPLSFAATTADTLEELTAGFLHGFALDGDFALRYTGTKPGKFLLNYSTSFTFAEAGVMFAFVKQNTSIVYRGRSRSLVATAGNIVTSSGNCILTLEPGDRVILFFQPSSHSGSDNLTVYECNVSLTQLR